MHFSIIVAGDDYEKQLEPFQENNMGDCSKELKVVVDGREIVAANIENGNETVRIR